MRIMMGLCASRILSRVLSLCLSLGLCFGICFGICFGNVRPAIAAPWIENLPHLITSQLVTGQAAPSIHTPVLLAQATVPPTEILSRLFTEDELQKSWFADSFLAQISLAEISQIIQGIEGSVGAYQSIEDVDNGFVFTFERGRVPAHLALNGQGQITGLLFETPQLTAVSIDDLVGEFEALPGSVHVLAVELVGETDQLETKQLTGQLTGQLTDQSKAIDIASLNADKPLAVGSTFKLLILQALREQIAAGEHQWDEVVPLQEAWKSLPSGFLQTWPEGSQLTLESLATLMISQSDNTATDHLLNIVGRQAVEALLETDTPVENSNRNDRNRNRPFLSTREAFVLKDPANVRVLRRWRRSDERRSLLSALAALPLPDVNIFNDGPQAIDVEWFLSARELCSAMDEIADLPLMSVNPGLVNPNDWEKVSFKGGSEPGVENFTTALVDANGRNFCVTATWNSEGGIDELQFSTLYRSLIESVKGYEDYHVTRQKNLKQQ
ncbi:MAG: serine hydrolase [Cyanobacteria bacterium P01_F01_bin.53]